MATVDNQQSWLPYDAAIGKDCSQGLCSMHCPQWCYSLFPPPSRAANDEAATFSPLVVAIIAILASALLLVSYYTFLSKKHSSLFFAADPREERHALPPNGLEEELINKIAVSTYRKEDAVVEGIECSVCLGEFREEESLRVLPKCGHGFHLQCIDAWLKSHANCPLCRASIVVEEGLDDEEIVVVVVGEDAEIGEEDAEIGRVSIADVLRVSVEECVVAKNGGLVGRNWGLNCVMRRVRMKRSVSSGRFYVGRQGRRRNFMLPV